jgi:peptidyl-tRNA hydrolase, PTH2 family
MIDFFNYWVKNMSRIYFLVNTDLEMSPGKLAAQVGHGMQYIMEYYLKFPDEQKEIMEYSSAGSTKIVLKCRQNKLLALYEKYKSRSFLVIDAGKTEISPGSATVLAFLPMIEPYKELKRLSLY